MVYMYTLNALHAWDNECIFLTPFVVSANLFDAKAALDDYDDEKHNNIFILWPKSIKKNVVAHKSAHFRPLNFTFFSKGYSIREWKVSRPRP